MIDGRTRLYGLVREDARQSWSPAIHAAAFAAQGLNSAYVPFSVAPGDLRSALTGAHALGFFGLNVGAPYKEGAAASCVALDPCATAIRAANTLVRMETGWYGHNTDALAFVEHVKAHGTGARSALVLGAGGAARATAWGCRALGLRTRIASREELQAHELCALLPDAAMDLVAWQDAARVATEVDCVVNAIPCDVEHTRAITAALRRDQLVVDWVYGGTELLCAAQRIGASIVSGNDLLVGQAALANALWTGLARPDAVMAAEMRRIDAAR